MRFTRIGLSGSHRTHPRSNRPRPVSPSLSTAPPPPLCLGLAGGDRTAAASDYPTPPEASAPGRTGATEAALSPSPACLRAATAASPEGWPSRRI
ncbi:hypothetical protein ACP70R_017316 [Stipagrostis hirtigluma subsp. patula]